MSLQKQIEKLAHALRNSTEFKNLKKYKNLIEKDENSKGKLTEFFENKKIFFNQTQSKSVESMIKNLSWDYNILKNMDLTKNYLHWTEQFDELFFSCILQLKEILESEILIS